MPRNITRLNGHSSASGGASDLERLKAKWEAKLKAEGLGETLSSGNPYRSGTVGHNVPTWQAKTEYFRQLGIKHHEYNYPSRLDESIMELWANGRTTGEIARELKARGVKRCGAQTVRYKVRRYETLWGVKLWTPAQRRQKP